MKETPGQMLKRHRKDFRLTQEHLATAIGMSRFSVNQIERDRHRITANVALRLSRVFSERPNAIQWLLCQAEFDLRAARCEFGDVVARLPVLEKR